MRALLAPASAQARHAVAAAANSRRPNRDRPISARASAEASPAGTAVSTSAHCATRGDAGLLERLAGARRSMSST